MREEKKRKMGNQVDEEEEEEEEMVSRGIEEEKNMMVFGLDQYAEEDRESNGKEESKEKEEEPHEAQEATEGHKGQEQEGSLRNSENKKLLVSPSKDEENKPPSSFDPFGEDQPSNEIKEPTENDNKEENRLLSPGKKEDNTEALPSEIPERPLESKQVDGAGENLIEENNRPEEDPKEKAEVFETAEKRRESVNSQGSLDDLGPIMKNNSLPKGIVNFNSPFPHHVECSVAFKWEKTLNEENEKEEAEELHDEDEFVFKMNDD